MLRFFARSVSCLVPPAPRMGSEERVFVPRKEKIRGCADDLNVCGFRRRHRLFARERQPHRRRFVRRADWGTRIPACASGAVPPVAAMGECGCALHICGLIPARHPTRWSSSAARSAGRQFDPQNMIRRRHCLFARERRPHRRRFVRRADWGTRIPACASGAVPPVTAMGECGCARPYLRPHTGKTPYSMVFFRRPQRVAVPEHMIHAVVCARRRATGTVGHGCRIGGGRSRNRCMKRIARRRLAAGCGMPCTGHDRRGGGIRATISLCGSDKGPCG